MGAWNTYSFSNDSVYDFLHLGVIPFRIMGGVDELEITKEILEGILEDVDNCTDDHIKMAVVVFLVYKGCSVGHKYIEYAITQAENEYQELENQNHGCWSDPQKRLIRLQEEIDNLKKAKIYEKIDPIHIPSIYDNVLEKSASTINY